MLSGLILCLQSNIVSHWLGLNLESALYCECMVHVLLYKYILPLQCIEGCYTETEKSSRWLLEHHWSHWRLSIWQPSMTSAMTKMSMWWPLCSLANVDLIIPDTLSLFVLAFYFFFFTQLSWAHQYSMMYYWWYCWCGGLVLYRHVGPEHMAVLKCSWHGLWRASQRWGGTDLNTRTSRWTNTGRLRRKWPQFWHFLMHFLEWKFLYIDSNFN